MWNFHPICLKVLHPLSPSMLTGPPGEPGATGAKGPDGPQGEQGNDGEYYSDMLKLEESGLWF